MVTLGNKSNSKKILLLGSGELGKEFIISAQRLGLVTIAIDKYAEAPAMHAADYSEAIDMLNAHELERMIQKYKPDIIVPEIEAIRTEKLFEFEKKGIQVVPSANAVHLTMNRDAIRDAARVKLKLTTAHYAYAESLEELKKKCMEIGFPNVVKPVMSSSGKGQSILKSKKDVEKAWDYAVSGMRGDKVKVIVEEFIPFDSEITLLTVKQKKGPTLFVNPIGHLQKRGDYQESWIPAQIQKKQLLKAQKMAKKVTDYLGGAGLFGVEFFITKKEIYFSELSPRPHDTGMVTLYSQDLTEFDLHLRAVLGLPIPEITYYGPTASAVILAEKESRSFTASGLEVALKIKNTDTRWFGKPTSHPFRRMGVALARGKTIQNARTKARLCAQKIKFNMDL